MPASVIGLPHPESKSPSLSSVAAAKDIAFSIELSSSDKPCYVDADAKRLLRFDLHE
jgi:hypothetical protein